MADPHAPTLADHEWSGLRQEHVPESRGLFCTACPERYPCTVIDLLDAFDAQAARLAAVEAERDQAQARVAEVVVLAARYAAAVELGLTDG